MSKKGKVDLHMHSDYSDGHNKPEEVIELLSANGIKLASLTDHDTMKGTERFRIHGDLYGVSTIPGVEVSTIYNGYDVHVIGLNVNHQLGGAEEMFECNNEERRIYTEKVMRKLNEMGVLNVTFDELTKLYEYPGYCVTLMHAMDFMIHKEGYNFEVARKAIFENDKLGIRRNFSMILPTQKGVGAILELGGIPILAHPGEFEKQIEGSVLEKRVALMELLQDFKSMGGRALEAFHSKHSEKQEVQYVSLAQSIGLAVTSGSDYHGRHKEDQKVGHHGVTVVDILNLLLNELKDVLNI